MQGIQSKWTIQPVQQPFGYMFLEATRVAAEKEWQKESPDSYNVYKTGALLFSAKQLPEWMRKTGGVLALVGIVARIDEELRQ